MKNTKKNGQLRFLIYKTGENEFMGVCLELNEIVVEKTPNEALRRILNASQGYVETVIKENLSDNLLNQRSPIKYYLLYYFAPILDGVLRMKKLVQIVQMPIENGIYGVKLLS